jgi:hypothetical protein
VPGLGKIRLLDVAIRRAVLAAQVLDTPATIAPCFAPNDYRESILAEEIRFRARGRRPTSHVTSSNLYSQSFEQRNKLLASQFRIAKYLPQKSSSNIPTGMDRYGHHAPILVFHPDVTALLPGDSKARFLQGTYEFVSVQCG